MKIYLVQPNCTSVLWLLTGSLTPPPCTGSSLAAQLHLRALAPQWQHNCTSVLWLLTGSPTAPPCSGYSLAAQLHLRALAPQWQPNCTSVHWSFTGSPTAPHTDLWMKRCQVKEEHQIIKGSIWYLLWQELKNKNPESLSYSMTSFTILVNFRESKSILKFNIKM